MFEVCVYIDDDDPTYRYYPQDLGCRYIIGPRLGYAKLHEMSGVLLKHATGTDWAFVFNDDAVMLTPHWDHAIISVPNDYVLCPVTNHENWAELNVFPIIPMKWIATAGWPTDAAIDTWWAVVSNMIKRVSFPPIEIRHDRFDLTGQNEDDTYRERNYSSKDFFSLRTYALMGYAAGKIHQRFYANHTR